MNTLIIISILPIVLLYLGLYKAQKALLPVTIIGLLLALAAAMMQWNSSALPIYHGMMLFDNYAIAFSGITIISTILILLLSGGYFEKISSHIAEYYAIILFSLAGIIVMVSFYNLVMLFIGIEIILYGNCTLITDYSFSAVATCYERNSLFIHASAIVTQRK